MSDAYGLHLSDLEFRNQFDIKSITEHIVTVSSIMLRGGYPKVTDVGIVPNLPEVKFGEKFVVYSNPFQLNEKYDNIQDYLVLNVEGQGLKILKLANVNSNEIGKTDFGGFIHPQQVLLPTNYNKANWNNPEYNIIFDTGQKREILEDYPKIPVTGSRVVPADTYMVSRGIIGCMVLR